MVREGVSPVDLVRIDGRQRRLKVLGRRRVDEVERGGQREYRGGGLGDEPGVSSQ